MRTFVAVWPDKSITVLSYRSGLDRDQYEDLLWADLDREADPFSADIYVMRSGTKLILENNTNYRFASEEEGGRRPLVFDMSADVFDRYLESIRNDPEEMAHGEMSNEVIATAVEIGVVRGEQGRAQHRLFASLRMLIENLKKCAGLPPLRDQAFHCAYDPKMHGGMATATLTVLGTKKEITVIREAVKDSAWTNKRQETA